MNPFLYFPKNTFSARFGKQIYTVEIVDYEVKDDSCFTAYANYSLIVKQGKSKWQVQHRFKDFEQLLLHCKELVTAETIAQLPILPPKTCYRRIDKEFLQLRIKQLNDFLDQLLTFLSKDRQCQSQIIEFLMLDPNLGNNLTES